MADGMDDDALDTRSAGSLSIQTEEMVSADFMRELPQDNVVKLDSQAGRQQVRPEPVRQPAARLAEIVSFDRRELDLILRLYGFKVASGEWRDYAIDMLRERAVFSVLRRSAEVPLYRIEKRPKLAQRQGMYAVVGMDGQVLKRGHDLRTVLRVLERKLIRSVD